MSSILPDAKREAIAAVVSQTVREMSVYDIHTHLYDPAFGELLLWGIDDQLVYHYLVAEAFRHFDIGCETFWRLAKEDQAQMIWDALFVENSPPEIYLPHQLNATFSKHGKVRFILLVHGMCGKNLCAFTGYCRLLEQRMNITLDKDNRGVAPWAMALHNYHQIITDFGEDVHVIRYEDLCLRWGRVLRDLAAWMMLNPYSTNSMLWHRTIPIRT